MVISTLFGGTNGRDAAALEEAAVHPFLASSPTRPRARRSIRSSVASSVGWKVEPIYRQYYPLHTAYPLTGADRELERSIGAGRELTETLLDFARPMLDTVPGADGRKLRALLEFAIRIRNASVAEESGGSAGFLAEIRAEIVAGRAPSEIIGWHDRLVARKRELFSGDLRFVGDWDLRQDRGGVHVEMETRVPAAVQARLESAGYKAQA